ncbi:MAG: hypothetical protein SPL99_11090 [Catonella sp.]|nr:hypothetical protein [Catonella sp.]MDY6356670.1 hypothetical protein [Catonella sp.]
MTSETREKYEHLKDYIKGLGSLGVAFSAGVDSTFLLKVGHDVLGPKCVAFSGISPSFPKKEQEEAKGFCAKENIRLILFNSTEMNDENYIKNPTNRCYYCKRDLFIKISELAKKENIGHIADGSNADDTGDYRPGAGRRFRDACNKPAKGNRNYEGRNKRNFKGIRTYYLEQAIHGLP